MYLIDLAAFFILFCGRLGIVLIAVTARGIPRIQDYLALPEGQGKCKTDNPYDAK